MLYYRPASGGKALSLGTVRTLTAAALFAYPAGALIREFGSGVIAPIVGFALIVVALMSTAALMGSSIQRIVGEQVELLDEFELKLRNRAVGSAYKLLSLLILLAVIYAAIASDQQWWIPHTYGEFSGLFWGAFLYCALLPSVFLTWIVEPSDIVGDGPVE
ncbi:MAG: hypothetical protein ABIR63_05890 [Sphingomicrobium sp.]